MKVDLLKPKEISNKWDSIYQIVEAPLSVQEGSKSRAGWRRIRSETPPSTIEDIEDILEDLWIQLDEAEEAGQYEKALQLIDQIIATTRDPLHSLSLEEWKSYFLKKLGRLEEAYLLITEALEKIPSYAEKAKVALKEEFLALVRDLIKDEPDKAFLIEDEEFLIELDLLINEAVNEELAQIQRDLLMERGFLALALNQKELAIIDFRKAAHCECDDWISDDPEFLFRVLEKALGAQIAPFKDYEKEITTLLEKNLLLDEEWYQLTMYCALLGQHDKAQEWYEKIKNTDDFPSEIPFFLAYLRGDMEAARKELDRCPNEDYSLFITLFTSC